MPDQSVAENAPEIQTQLILLAASKHDTLALKALLRNGSANVQDPETGFTPLHAAIAACDNVSPILGEVKHVNTVNEALAIGRNGGINASEANGLESDMSAAAKTIKLILQNGGIWNDLDKNGETPGCLALRLGLDELYEIMVDAGVRAELLLSRLDEYEPLTDDEEEQEDGARNGSAVEILDEAMAPSGNIEMTASLDGERAKESDGAQKERSNEDFLQASLRFQDGCILDDDGNGVMMAWETEIMKRSADLLCPTKGLRILNVGHGMGIIDHFFQNKDPLAHHIIEAHPQVLERMRKDGWYEKSNVTIHEGRWQDAVLKIMEEGILFDAIYFDTFAEDYKAFRDFFSDCLIGLLDDGGKWGFFNGMGADRQICYDVYTKVVEMDLFEAGFDVAWEVVPVREKGTSEWKGVRRRYWYVFDNIAFSHKNCILSVHKLKTMILLLNSKFVRAPLTFSSIYRSLRDYKLPVCTFIG